jgi:hypothetical protein
MNAINEVFPEKSITEEETDLLSIEISNLEQANLILSKLSSANIEPVEYAISQASLDEVFLTFTGEKTNE